MNLRIFVLLVSTLFLLVLTVGCTPSASPTATAPSGATKPAATAEPGAAPTATSFYGAANTLDELAKRFPFPPPPSKAPLKYGGMLVIPTSPWADLDPRIGNVGYVHYVVYESLFEQKLGWDYPEVQGKMESIPLMVEGWDNPDPLTYIFRLRKDIKWQNLPPVNGREFVADDVKYALESHMKGGALFNKVADISKIDVLDKYTVKITLKQSYGSFITDKLGAPRVLGIFSKEADQAEGSLKDPKNIVGTGAFQIQEVRAGESMTFVKNPNYYQKDFHPRREGKEIPYLDKVRVLVFKDLPAQIAAFRVGQIDASAAPDWETVRDILKTNPDTFVYRVPSAVWGNHTAFFRLDREPYSDVRVRRALSMAIDRQSMRETLYGDKDDGDIFGPFSWVWTWPEWPRDYSKLGPWYEYDPKKAKELLAEAGYPNGFKAKMQFMSVSNPPYEEGALMVKEFWRKIGVDVELVKVETASMSALINQGTWDDILWHTITVAGPSYDDLVYWTYHSGAPIYMSQDKLSDPVVDKMLDEQRQKYAAGSPEHTKAAQELFKYLTDKMYRIPTVIYHRYEVQQPWLQEAPSAPYNWYVGFAYYTWKYSWFSDKAPKR